MSPIEDHYPIAVLLVEDNPGDVRLAAEALRGSGMDYSLRVVSTGAEAMSYLMREGEFAAAPRPKLIILDLKLPAVDGFEILARIKGNDTFRRIPVTVLTSSGAATDIHRAYSFGANCYVVKPGDLDEYIRVLRSVLNFWVNVVELPHE